MYLVRYLLNLEEKKWMPYLSKTFDGRLELLETYLGRIHVKVKKDIWKMITHYYVSLHLSKITLNISINYSCVI